MDKWILALITILVVPSTNVLAERNGSARYRIWNVFETFFADAFKYLKHGISKLIDGSDMTLASITRIKDNKISYSGYQVLRVKTLKEAHVKALKGLPDDIDGSIKFWTTPIAGYHTDVFVPPDAVDEVKEQLKKKSLGYEVMIQDLQKLIAYENPKMRENRRITLLEQRGHAMTWTMYHRFSDIRKYMDVLAHSFRNLVQLITIGYSSEGLPLKVIKVSTTGSRGTKLQNKTAIWIDGGMYGREWITSSVVLYVVKELTEKYKRYKKIVDQVDWYLMPVANPDGYEYSHSTDRLWKKTRSTYEDGSSYLSAALLSGHILSQPCKGVDLNRNFDYHWGEDESPDDPCSEIYAGPKVYSEPESRAISNFIMEHKENLKVFVTLRSYSQMWLTPGRGNNKTSSYELALATKVVNAIRGVLGTNYGVGMSSTFYPYSGCSQDWAKEIAKIRYTYLVELRDKGHYGFLLPANQILPTAKETFAAIKQLVTMIISTNNRGR